VKAFGVWHNTDTVQIQLLPEGTANDDLRPLLEQGLSCEYVVKKIHVPGLLMDAVFSDDGQLIATGSNDRYARVWQISDGKEFTQPFNHEKEGLVSYVKFMNNSNCLISFAAKIHTWSLNDKSDQSCFQAEYPAGDYSPDTTPNRRVLVSPTGKYIVQENQDGIIIEKWEGFGIGKKVMTIPSRNYNFIGFSQDENVFLTVGGDHTARVWDIVEGKERSRFSYDGDIIVHEVGPQIPIHSLSLSPDGNLFMIGVQNTNANSEIEEKNLLRVFTTSGVTAQVQFDFSEIADCMAISSDNRFVVSAGKDKHQQLQYVTDYSVRVAELDTGKEIAKLSLDRDITSVAFSRDGKLIAVGTDDSKVRLWNWKEAAQNIKIMSHEGSGDIQSIAFSPNGLYIASAGRDNTARLWLVSDATPVAAMRHQNNTNRSVNRIEFDRDGTYLLTASSDKTAMLWRVPDGQPIRTFKSNDWVLDARFSPDGKYVATASADGYARLWAVNSLTDNPIFEMKHQRTLENNKIVNAVKFSPDGKFLATASGDWDGLWGGDMTPGDVRIWRIPSGEPFTQISHPYTVWDVEFSPDGKHIASSSSDGKLRIWDTINGDESSRINLLFPNRGPKKIYFSENGKYVASPGEVYLWRSQDLINLAQNRITRSLTQSEKDEYFLRTNLTKYNLSKELK
jgi:WD40 repeat protein